METEIILAQGVIKQDVLPVQQCYPDDRLKIVCGHCGRVRHLESNYTRLVTLEECQVCMECRVIEKLEREDCE